MRFLSTTALALIAASGAAFAQNGDNSCSNATPISGVGNFMFDNTGATLDGLGDAACNKFGTNQVNNDIWYLWTAPATASYTMETCSLTGLDTKLAVYDNGPCPPAPPLDCNDDTCGLQSQVTWTASAGSQYLLRLGTFSAAAFGSGDFMISGPTGPVNIGTNYCQANANSSGNLATITAQGSTSVAAQSLSLESSGMPAGVNGIFYYGTNNPIIPAFGDGFRCVGGVIQRLPFLAADGAGVMTEPDVYSNAMNNLMISATTLHFQSWFRDPTGPGGSGFNLSNGLTINFTP